MFPVPTAENIASWIFAELKKDLSLSSVKLWEGEGKWVEVTE
jgi:6-pyruvoyl-tetrahydropterin synthase